MAWTRDHDQPGTQHNRGDPGAPAGAGWSHTNLGSCQLRPCGGRGEQAGSFVQHAVLCGPHNQIDRCRLPREACMDIALAIGHDHHRGGIS
jgi:hypothetical protein